MIIFRSKKSKQVKENKKEKSSSLRRKMVFYFLLMALANVFVGLELLWEIGGDKYHQKVKTEIIKIKEGKAPIKKVFVLLDELARKFIIMVGILILVSAIILFLFVVRIASPIQYMIDKSKQIADGDLSATIEMKSNDEIATLGNLINDLTANLQEIIAQLDQVFASLQEAILRTEAKIDEEEGMAQKFIVEKSQLQDAMESLSLLKDSFQLFKVETPEFNHTNSKTKKLGEILIDDNIITPQQLEHAMEEQKKQGGFLGKILTDMKFVDQITLVKYLSQQDR